MNLAYIEEGFFKNGKKHGYCRVYDCIAKTVECGFYEKDVPHGKLMVWDKDGQLKKDMGLYKGKNCEQKVEILNFNSSCN